MKPIQTLFDAVTQGEALPLPDALASLYGPLRFATRTAAGPRVIGNFVSTLDGVVSLKEPGKATGGPISGDDPSDLMLMGLLRACADVVLEGAGTLRQAPGSLLSAQDVCPAYADAYLELRARLHRPATPIACIVSESGELDLGLRLFASGEMPVVVLTRAAGAGRLRKQPLPAGVEIKTLPGDGPLRAREMIDALALDDGLVLVEGGPRLMNAFVAAHCLDELFLTVAPQIAGRDDVVVRPGFVAGQAFAPADPRWGELLGVMRAGSHLFLRYGFAAAGN